MAGFFYQKNGCTQLKVTAKTDKEFNEYLDEIKGHIDFSPHCR